MFPLPPPPSRITVCAEIARRPLLKFCGAAAGAADVITAAGGRATPPPPPRGRVSRLEGGGCCACLPVAAQGLPSGECGALAPPNSLMRPTSSSSDESPCTFTTRIGLLPSFRDAGPPAAVAAPVLPAPARMPTAPPLGECVPAMRGARLAVPSS